MKTVPASSSPVEDSRPIIACLGNCQSRAISSFLRTLPELSHDYEIIGLRRATVPYLKQNRERVRLVINQETHEWTPNSVKREDMPAGCKWVSYPAALLNYQWPQLPSYARKLENRNSADALFPYTICDDRVIRLREAGVSKSDLLGEYYKVAPSEIFRLDRLKAINELKARAIDEKSDFGIADFIEREGARQSLFRTANHPNGPLLAYMLAGIVESASGIITDQRLAAYKADQQKQGFGIQPVEAPVHPDVARHFGLTWAENKRFRFWGEGDFSFDHWLLRLYDYDYCRPFREASDLIAERRYDAAEPLLREAMAMLPESVTIKQTLAGVVGRRGDPIEAAELLGQVYRADPTGSNLDRYFTALRRVDAPGARAFVSALSHIPEDAVQTRLAWCRDAPGAFGDKGGSMKDIHVHGYGSVKFWNMASAIAAKVGDADAQRDHLARCYYVSNWAQAYAVQLEQLTGRPPDKRPVSLDYSVSEPQEALLAAGPRLR